jgi:hypothetical protein
MKQLIGSCIELVRARSRHGKLRHETLKQQLCRKLIKAEFCYTSRDKFYLHAGLKDSNRVKPLFAWD